MTVTMIPIDDPMAMIQAVREKIYEETKDMSHEEFSLHLRKQCESACRRIELIDAVPVEKPVFVKAPPDDPVKMVRAIRNKHYEETKNMTTEQRREYDRQKTESFDRRKGQVNPDDHEFPFLSQKSDCAE